MRALWLVLLIGCAAEKSAEAPMGSASSTTPQRVAVGGSGGLNEDPCGGGQVTGRNDFKAGNGPGVGGEEAPAAPDVSGSLARDEIVRTVKASMKPVRECFIKARVEVASKIVITFTIEANGSVSKADATGGPADVMTCVASVFRTLKFPASSSSSVIRYPIVFQPS